MLGRQHRSGGTSRLLELQSSLVAEQKQGSNAYAILSRSPKVATLYAYSRKELPLSDKLKRLQSTDTSSWAGQYPTGAQLFISGLGTTRAAAGGFDNQWKIDHDLNLELAKAAKAAGTKAYVLISSSGASSTSPFGYPKMKGKLEDAVKELGFDHVVILRPGLIVGERTEQTHGAAELVLRKTATYAGSVSNKLKDFWAQDAEVIAKAAVKAGLDCVDGKEKETFKILGQAGESCGPKLLLKCAFPH